jgi:hypothetical protein
MFLLCYFVLIRSSLCLAVFTLSFVILASTFIIGSNLLGAYLPFHDLVYATIDNFSDSTANIRSDEASLDNLSGVIYSNVSTTSSNKDSNNTLTSSNSTSTGPQPGTLQIPYTGLSRHHVSPEDAKLFGLNENAFSMIVTEVDPRSPAAIAGIRGGNITTNVAGDMIKLGGDMILRIDGNDTFIRTNEAFLNYLRNEKEVGENMTLTVLRDGQINDVNLTIGALPRFLWYEDNDEGIRIKYPSDWEISETESIDDVVKFFAPQNVRIGNETVPAAGIFVRMEPAATRGLDDLATAEQRDTSTKRHLGITLTSVSNLPGYESVFYEYSDENRTLKEFSMFTIKDGLIYRINFATDPFLYDDYSPLAMEVIRSFQFTR